MAAPNLVGDYSLNLFKNYFPKLELIMCKMHKFDLDKIIKINNYYNRHKVLTQKQYRAFKHYCKVYEIDIPISLHYMMED